ncbi:Tyrosinase orsC [Lecanosticta acicola]|uniref:Tyrosinase orsC n=1 Tax=Lecanosticta acicola TaxID=111012 RepID=A0AAI9EB06_9PEZI|nr:Tyrosinase orsC [Lecanosticta acicola]
MRFQFLPLVALIGAGGILCAPISTNGSDVDALEAQVAQLAIHAYRTTEKAVQQIGSPGLHNSSTCSSDKLRVRREWFVGSNNMVKEFREMLTSERGSLSKSQRRDYIRAVRCLQTKPALTPLAVAAGAKTRYDDFVVVHINQTLTIHYTANFLSWHRYFTWSYEEALRNECGYQGDQPYWDWAKTARDGLLSSPIFDGSDTSMSGNGANTGNKSDVILSVGSGYAPIDLPSGSGGGCVTKGAFANMTVNLGPESLPTPGGVTETAPSGNALDWNPRCLKRDLVDAVNQRYANYSSVLSLLSTPKIIYDFQMQMQGVPGTGELGVHGGGHYTLGGDPGRDVYVSPGDPMFFLHHGNIDRVWWIWQMLSPYERQFTDKAISGTRTFLDSPASANGTLNDTVQFGYAAGPPRPIRDLLSTVNGPFCYTYL